MLLTVVLVAVPLMAWPVPAAQAVVPCPYPAAGPSTGFRYNRYDRCTYFTNESAFYTGVNFSWWGQDWIYENGMSGGAVDQTGQPTPNITSADTFINQIEYDLSRNVDVSCWPDVNLNIVHPALMPDCNFNKKRAVGAAFYIMTMLNINQDDPATQINGSPIRAILYARGVLFAGQPNIVQEWEQLIRAYDEGVGGASVNWNFRSFPFAVNEVDSWSVHYGNDVSFIQQSFAENTDAIVFTRPDGKRYIISRKCGNVKGEANPLNVLPDFSVTAGLSVVGADPVPGVSTLLPGGTYRLDAWTQSMTAPSYDPTVLEVAVTSTAPGQPVASVAQDLSPPLYSGAFLNNVIATGATAWHWYWKYPYLSAGFRRNTSFQFQVPAGLANGTQICFRPYASPEHKAGGVFTGASFCYSVQVPRYPAVIANNGDVHAGGGLCGSASSAGKIFGNPAGSSSTEYTVSSPGSISSFASNGPAGNTLNVDGYLPACRPDLYAGAQRYLASGGVSTPWPSATFGVADKAGVYTHTGNIDVPAGTVNSSGTLVVNGDVTISGIVQLDNALRARDQLAALGIIASGKILIAPSVTRVDALLFANGEIETCSGAGNCNNVLTVNGFMMAKSLLLGRLGTANSQGPQQAEVVALTPQLFLNPPVLFDSASVDNVNLDGQGENAPLF